VSSPVALTNLVGVPRLVGELLDLFGLYGIQVRVSRSIRSGDVFLVPPGQTNDLAPDWNPYAEGTAPSEVQQDVQRVSRYEHILENDD